MTFPFPIVSFLLNVLLSSFPSSFFFFFFSFLLSFFILSLILYLLNASYVLSGRSKNVIMKKRLWGAQQVSTKFPYCAKSRQSVLWEQLKGVVHKQVFVSQKRHHQSVLYPETRRCAGVTPSTATTYFLSKCLSLISLVKMISLMLS